MSPREALDRKLHLLARGVRLAEEMPEAPPWLVPGVSVDLGLEGGPLVRVRVRERGAHWAYALRPHGGGSWSVADGDWSAPAELLTRRGPASLGTVRGRFLVLSLGVKGRALPSFHDVVEEIRAVFAEGRADFVRLVVGADGAARGAVPGLVREIRNHFDTAVQAVTGPLPPELALEWYAGGIDALAVEAHPEVPGLGDLWARAGAVFPAGTVTWHLPWDPAWAPRARGLFEACLAAQVVPVVDLAPLAARGGPLLAGTSDGVAGVLEALQEATRVRPPRLLWLQEEGDEVGPLEAAALAGDGLGLAGWVRGLAGTGVGFAAARGLAHLRRQLRVRRVRHSFESAGL